MKSARYITHSKKFCWACLVIPAFFPLSLLSSATDITEQQNKDTQETRVSEDDYETKKSSSNPLESLPKHSQQGPEMLLISGLHFEPPQGWINLPATSPMRVAEFSVPSPEIDSVYEPGQVVFFHFPPGDGGSVDANITRWFGQFHESPQEINARTVTEKYNNFTITFVAAEGTYKSGMPGGPTTPKPGFALRGAIVQTPLGNVFIRFTGPQKLVEITEQSFVTMVRNAVINTNRT